MSNLYFQICAVFLNILVLIIYFSKKRIDSKETRIYGFLIIAALTDSVVMSLLIFLSYINPIIPVIEILNKIDFIAYIAWSCLFFLYIYYISFIKNDNFSKKYSLVRTLAVIFNIFGVVLVVLAPISIKIDGDIMYSYGMSTNIVYLFCLINFIGIIIVSSVNIKNLINKKYIPLLIFFIMIFVLFIVRVINPSLLLIPIILSYITLIMYFTIENPDLKMIEQLNIAREQAEKANSAKSDFLSSMSHEIRTPLNAIVGFSQMLLEGNIPEESKEEVKDIIMASDNLLEIVNGVLDISKIEANKLEIIESEYNFKKIYNDLVKLTKVRIGEKPIILRANLDPTIPDTLYGDHTRVKQVILNLLTNAAKYTNEGYITFTASSVKKDGVCRLIISVEDTGRGIKTEKVDKLFTKFERLETDRNTTIEGTGLGLAIAKKLLELMNGKIVVQSEYGEGSKFTVAIDQKIVNKMDIQEEKETIEIKEFSNKKVLVVDDNKINLKVAGKFLQAYKVDITLVESGFECIGLINKGINFDLILMDDMMPKMSGVETYKKLQEIPNFSIPTIALTANAISGMKEKYLSEGFNDYLSKPIDKGELNRIIQQYLNN